MGEQTLYYSRILRERLFRRLRKLFSDNSAFYAGIAFHQSNLPHFHIVIRSEALAEQMAAEVGVSDLSALRTRISYLPPPVRGRKPTEHSLYPRLAESVAEAVTAAGYGSVFYVAPALDHRAFAYELSKNRERSMKLIPRNLRLTRPSGKKKGDGRLSTFFCDEPAGARDEAWNHGCEEEADLLRHGFVPWEDKHSEESDDALVRRARGRLGEIADRRTASAALLSKVAEPRGDRANKVLLLRAIHDTKVEAVVRWYKNTSPEQLWGGRLGPQGELVRAWAAPARPMTEPAACRDWAAFLRLLRRFPVSGVTLGPGIDSVIRQLELQAHTADGRTAESA